jgi:hypothetical protein
MRPGSEGLPFDGIWAVGIATPTLAAAQAAIRMEARIR